MTTAIPEQDPATERRKVLFVDDEPNVLSGLKRMLRVMRQEWDMQFVEEPAEALNILSSQSVDVLVTDLKLRRFSGESLLRRSDTLYPETVRIVLTAEAQQKALVEAAGLAHQYLSKPCDADTLKATIQRALSLRKILDNASLVKLVSQLRTIPTLPSAYFAIQEAIQSPSCSMKQIGEIIAEDASLSAKIMQLVNFAYSRFRNQVANPADAAALLGIDTLKAFVLSAHLLSQLNESALRRCGLMMHRDHSLRVGTGAKIIARELRVEASSTDESFTAGLLHDLGKLVIAANIPDAYIAAVDLARDQDIPIPTAEQSVIGTTHARVGAYLLGLWGLSEAIVEAVAVHHDPDRITHSGPTVATAVHLANQTVHAVEVARADGDPDALTLLQDRLDPAFVERYGLERRLPHLLELIQQSFER